MIACYCFVQLSDRLTRWKRLVKTLLLTLTVNASFLRRVLYRRGGWKGKAWCFVCSLLLLQKKNQTMVPQRPSPHWMTIRLLSCHVDFRSSRSVSSSTPSSRRKSTLVSSGLLDVLTLLERTSACELCRFRAFTGISAPLHPLREGHAASVVYCCRGTTAVEHCLCSYQ